MCYYEMLLLRDAMCCRLRTKTEQHKMEAHDLECAGNCGVRCGWTGVAAEQAAHEAACPNAVRLRLMPAPLHRVVHFPFAQSQRDVLQIADQNRAAKMEAHARASSESTSSESDQASLAAHPPALLAADIIAEAACPNAAAVHPQSQELQAEPQAVSALEGAQLLHTVVLEPLVSALEGDAEEGDAEAGGLRQRQRVGPAPHDAPPSGEEVDQMGVVAAVAALRAHGWLPRVAEEACARVAGVCREDEGSRQPAVEAGALTAVVAAMEAHPQVVGVQEVGVGALLFVCSGINAAAPARKQRAVAAGALEAVVAAMQAHPQEVGVQQRGCVALSNVCGGTDAAAPARNQRAVAAGALTAVAAAMQVAPCGGAPTHGW